MTCEKCRDAVSAGLDGEASEQELDEAKEHFIGCAACRTWQRETESLDRRLRVRSADHVPDLSAAVAATAGDLRRHGRTARRRTAVRLGLVGVSGAQLAVALPELSGRVHAGNEAASWSVAAAVGLLCAAATPRRVTGMLPLLGAAAVVLLLITVRDVLGDNVHVEHELSHGLLVAGVGLLWLLRDRGTDPPQRDGDVLAPRPDSAGMGQRAA